MAGTPLQAPERRAVSRRRRAVQLALIAGALVGAAFAWNLFAGRSVARYRLAVGWSGALPSWSGRCHLATAKPAGVLGVGPSGAPVARRQGVVRVRCERGDLELDVSPPDRLRLDAPPRLPLGGKHIVTVTASDARGELDLGDVSVTWTVTPPLHRLSQCTDMGFCAGARSIRLRGDRPGLGGVTAHALGLTATATVEVEPR